MTSHRFGPFEVESRKDHIRTALGAAVLIGMGEPLLTGLAHWSTLETLHRAIRIWSGATSRYLGMIVDMNGMEHVDPEETYVVAPLHEGFADPLLLSRLPLRLRYLVRDELFEWRHLGRFLRASGQMEVATQAGHRDLRLLVSECRAIVHDGGSIVVFPQGSILGVEVAFTRGAFALADRMARPLLPIVITGTHRVWEHPYHPTLRFGQDVSMSVLPPVPAGEALARMSKIEAEMKDRALANRVAAARRFDPERDGYWDGYDYEIDLRFPEVKALVDRHRSAGPPEHSANQGL